MPIARAPPMRWFRAMRFMTRSAPRRPAGRLRTGRCSIRRSTTLWWATCGPRRMAAGRSAARILETGSRKCSAGASYHCRAAGRSRRRRKKSSRFYSDPNSLLIPSNSLQLRATEQALINVHKLAKNGGTLANKMNSIAEKPCL